MDNSTKKITGIVLLAVGVVIIIASGFFIFLQNRSHDEISDGEGSYVQSSDENTEKIEDFSEGIEAQKTDDSFLFESESGSSEVSARIPESFPEDVYVPENAELTSAVTASSENGSDRISVYWRYSVENFEYESEFGQKLIAEGWIEVEGQVYDAGGYYRYEKGDRSIDVSYVEDEDVGVDVVLTVDVE